MFIIISFKSEERKYLDNYLNESKYKIEELSLALEDKSKDYHQRDESVQSPSPSMEKEIQVESPVSYHEPLKDHRDDENEEYEVTQSSCSSAIIQTI